MDILFGHASKDSNGQSSELPRPFGIYAKSESFKVGQGFERKAKVLAFPPVSPKGRPKAEVESRQHYY